jgi:Fe-S-cluster containining protein
MGWQTELSKLYKELDEVLSEQAPECRACGQCCHFEDFGHVLYASSLEVDYLLRGAGSPKRPIKKEVCPYLVDNLCTAREHRTLGCRLFFCQEGWQTTSQDIYETYYRRIKELAIKYQLEWYYAPMVSALGGLKEEAVEK